MQAIHCTSAITYWIAGDGEQVIHFGALQPGENVTTGQPAIYATEDRAQWITQLVRLGITIDENGEPVAPATP